VPDPISVEGWSCWRRARCRRAAFLIDARDTFAAIASALEQARRSILICGWDLHSSLRLRRPGPPGAAPDALAPLLSWLVERRPRLQVHILLWDFAMIYALDRQVLPVFHLGWRTPRRIHFRLDGEHPLGASRHRKVVVVDDAVAFVGGLDLTARRFDDRAHRPENPERVDPWGHPFGPFHDVQMAVAGEVARNLGDLLRSRWERVTGRRIDPVEEALDPWPKGLASTVEDTVVAVARTEPAWQGQPEVREIERSLVAGIGAARSRIYLENQYLTSAAMGDALAARLGEPTGPEVVVVGPRRCEGWLEEATMGALRAGMVRRLREADRHGRLHLYAPMASRARNVSIRVHSKVTVIDDAFLSIGSANLSNRSMGLDAECNLTLEAAGRSDVACAIAGLRRELVAEHLGVAPETLAAAESEAGLLGAAIERLRGGDRTLVPLDAEAPLSAAVLPPPSLVDPERPVGAAELMQELVPADPLETQRSPARRIAAAGIVLAAFLVAWNFSALESLLARDGLALWLEPLQGGIDAWLAWLVVYLVASFAMVPVTALIAACGLLLGPWRGFGTALPGALVAALAGYGVGHLLPRETIRRLAGRRLNRMSRTFARGGFAAVAAVRLAPIAPFATVNLVAGASRLRARDFALGTALGMAPGILALTLFADRALAAIRDPGLETAAGLAAVTAVGSLGLRWLRQQLPEEKGRRSS
jgi:phospholipase D1/2